MTEMSRHLSQAILVEDAGCPPDAAMADPVNAVTATLQGLRAAVPNCHVAAFVDLSSQMVLAFDARSKQPQERLDSIAARAAEVLGEADVLISETTPDVPNTAAPDYALALSPTNLEVYLRSTLQPDEALGLICALDVAFEDLLIRGEAALRAIAGGK